MPKGVYPLEKRKNLFQKGHTVPQDWREATSKLNRTYHHTEEAKKKIREASLKQGRKPPTNYGRFRDGIARYTSVHQWVVRERGVPTRCEHCGKDGLTGHKIQWANIDHKYKRNVNDYMRLCTKCHRIHDKQLI